MRTFDLDQHWPALAARVPQNSGRAEDVRLATAGKTGDALASAPPSLGSTVPLSNDGLEFATENAELARSARVAAGLRTGVARSYRFVRGFDPTAAVWLSMGFIAGMAAWHAVGFWGFVSATVLKDPDRSPAVAVQSAPLQPRVHFNSVITTGSTMPASTATFSPQPSACLALVVDRTSGATNAVACRADQQPLRDAGRRKRTDRMPGIEARLQNAGSWATDTRAEVATSRDGDGRGTLNDRDFDLTVVSE